MKEPGLGVYVSAISKRTHTHVVLVKHPDYGSWFKLGLNHHGIDWSLIEDWYTDVKVLR